MEMEVDKTKMMKKKRVITRKVEEERERLKKLNGAATAEAADGSGNGSGSVDAVVVPSEEDVEEFFAILKRMKVAVKYFDEKGRGGKKWREALELAEVPLVDDGENVDDDGEVGKLPEQKGGEVIMNEGLDLNEVAPEGAESGGE